MNPNPSPEVKKIIEEFRKRYPRALVCDYFEFKRDVDYRIDIESFLLSSLQQLEEEVRRRTLNDIRRWMKGRQVTKDKIRQFLNEYEEKGK